MYKLTDVGLAMLPVICLQFGFEVYLRPNTRKTSKSLLHG